MEAGMWTNRTTHLAGIALSALILIWLLASAVSVHAQSGDVTSVLRDFHAALNAGNVDGSLAFFADDGVADIQGDISSREGCLTRMAEQRHLAPYPC